MQNHNYEKTAEINHIVGNVANPADLAGLQKQIDLIEDEIQEGVDNLPFLCENPEALRDDVCDVLFTAYGLAGRMGYAAEVINLAGFAAVTAESDYEAMKKITQLVANEDVKERATQLLSGMKETLAILELRLSDEDLVPDDAEERADWVKRTSLVDILLLLSEAYQLGIICGYPVNDDYQVVIDSNTAKFDSSLVDAMNTKAKYKAMGVQTEYLETTITGVDGTQSPCFVTKSAVDQECYKGVKFRKGKWLKSHLWKEPVFEPIAVTV